MENFTKKKYGEHSQFGQFFKLSHFTDLRVPVQNAIHDFEKNIVFDKGNYVYHRSWGLGLITELTHDNLVVDFSESQGHVMSIQMGLQSLLPVAKDHLYVLLREDAEGIKSLFKEDFISFFEILIKSYGGEITQQQIKKDVVPKFIEEKNWSKWWSSARAQIKKNPHFEFSDTRKDLVIMRDKPVTYAEALLDRFKKEDSFSGKLSAALEFVNNVAPGDGGAGDFGFLRIFYNSGKVRFKYQTHAVVFYTEKFFKI